jgi:putative ABC transport system ATP-binding protein
MARGVHDADRRYETGDVVVAAQDLTKTYGSGQSAVRALAGVSAGFAKGEFTAIMGPSGSGKSTFMHCLAGLDTVDAGTVTIGGTRIDDLGDTALTRLRRNRLGFVFQSFNLLPTLTAQENILLPLQLAGTKVDREWFRHLVGVFGLSDRLGHRPSELSGGQQQRVACARALVGRPLVVFADEPTGNLDSRSGTELLTFLRTSVHELGQTVVMVTHDPVAASFTDRVLFLADGRLVHELREPSVELVLDRISRVTEGVAA